eukprot:4781295-Amphidinium_carterae.2
MSSVEYFSRLTIRQTTLSHVNFERRKKGKWLRAAGPPGRSATGTPVFPDTTQTLGSSAGCGTGTSISAAGVWCSTSSMIIIRNNRSNFARWVWGTCHWIPCRFHIEIRCF